MVGIREGLGNVALGCRAEKTIQDTSSCGVHIKAAFYSVFIDKISTEDGSAVLTDVKVRSLGRLSWQVRDGGCWGHGTGGTNAGHPWSADTFWLLAAMFTSKSLTWHPFVPFTPGREEEGDGKGAGAKSSSAPWQDPPRFTLQFWWSRRPGLMSLLHALRLLNTGKLLACIQKLSKKVTAPCKSLISVTTCKANSELRSPDSFQAPCVRSQLFHGIIRISTFHSAGIFSPWFVPCGWVTCHAMNCVAWPGTDRVAANRTKWAPWITVLDNYQDQMFSYVLSSLDEKDTNLAGFWKWSSSAKSHQSKWLFYNVGNILLMRWLGSGINLLSFFFFLILFKKSMAIFKDVKIQIAFD